MFGKYNYLVNIERQEVAVCTACVSTGLYKKNEQI